MSSFSCSKPHAGNDHQQMQTVTHSRLRSERINEWTRDTSNISTLDSILSCGAESSDAPYEKGRFLTYPLAEVYGVGTIVVAGGGPMWLDDSTHSTVVKVQKAVKVIRSMLADNRDLKTLGADAVTRLEEKLEQLLDALDECDEKQLLAALDDKSQLLSQLFCRTAQHSNQ